MGLPYEMEGDARRPRLGVQMTDFGLTYGVGDETTIFLAIKVSFRVKRNEIKKTLSYYFDVLT